MAQYLIKFADKEPEVYSSENGYRGFAEDGLCNAIWDYETGKLLFERKNFYLIVKTGLYKNVKPARFSTYNIAYRWGMKHIPNDEWYISPLLPEEWSEKRCL